jgi:NAD(P)-dependent dehydrogenase (short-subunit alcohol dehydrogenase family)
MNETTAKKIVLITGATSGIGRFTALHLCHRGYRVLASGRNAEALADLARESGGKLETVRLDVTDRASIAAARAEIDRRTSGHGVDVLINNAGYGTVGPMEEMTEADLRAQYETNVFGLVAVTQAFVPQMRARRAGRVINVSSIGGKVTFPLFGAYNSTKYAIESMSDALRMELLPFGVQVVLVEPGVIRTHFADRAMREVAKYKNPDSPYAAVLARAEELERMTHRQAVGPEVIARVMERAIRSARPRARYMAPLRGKLMIAVLRVLPTRWTDALMRRIAGLTRRRLLVAPAPTPRSQLDTPSASA